MKRNIRYWTVNVGVLLCVTLVLLEVSLRVLPLFAPEPLKSLLKEAARVPLSNVRTFPATLIGGVAIHLPERHKADLLVVGDSFPFGTYVAEKATFPSLLGHFLDVTVVNLGVGSQSAPQANRMLEVGMRYEPRIVLYCVFANDFLPYAYTEIRKLSVENSTKVFATDRNLYVETLSWWDRVGNLRKRLTNTFLSIQLLKLFQQPIQKISQVEWSDGKTYFAFVEKAYWKNLHWGAPHVEENLKKLVQVILPAYEFAADQGLLFFVVLLPPKEFVYAEVVRQSNRDLAEKIFHKGFAKTYDMFAKTLREAGVSVIDVTMDLKQAASLGKKLYFSIDGHLNEAGHSETAKSLARHLRERHLP